MSCCQRGSGGGWSGAYSMNSSSNGRGRGGGGGRGRGRGGPPQCFRCGAIGHTSATCTSDNVKKQEMYTVPPLPAHSVPYIDTHCHVDYMCENARVGSWAEFKAMNKFPETYGGCITTYCDSTAILSSFSQFDDLVSSHPEVHHTFGLHPHNAKHWNDRIEEKIIERVADDRCVGWGEIGLDVTSAKKGGSAEDEQIIVFMRQLELAQSLCPDKTVVIHYRGDGQTLVELLQPIPKTQKLHLHCWGDPDPTVANTLLDLFPNLCFGFTGHICNNSKLVNTVRAVPLDRILLETDGPYMLPNYLKPPKGSRIMMPVNHSGSIPYVADEIAKLKGISIDEVLLACLDNTFRMYGVSPLIQDAPQKCKENSLMMTSGSDSSQKEEDKKGKGEGRQAAAQKKTSYSAIASTGASKKTSASPQPKAQPRRVSKETSLPAIKGASMGGQTTPRGRRK